MNKLTAYIVNPFLTIKVARPRVQKFAFDHIQRVTSAANPHFAQIITDTTAIWQILFGNIETYDQDINDQVSLTNQLNKKMKEFTDNVVDLEPFVLTHYKKTDPVYHEFFPHGLTEYHNINQSTALVLMDRIIDKTHAYSTDVGATWEPLFTQIHDSYEALFAGQKEKMGEVDGVVSNYEEKVIDLYVQLYKNAMLIIAEYPKHPERLLDFFNETLVNFESHIHPLTIAPSEQKASDLNFTVDDTIVITSKCAKVLKYFFAPTAESQLVGAPQLLAANAKIKVTGPAAGAPANKFVIFINDTDTAANIEVRLE